MHRRGLRSVRVGLRRALPWAGRLLALAAACAAVKAGAPYVEAAAAAFPPEGFGEAIVTAELCAAAPDTALLPLRLALPVGVPVKLVGEVAQPERAAGEDVSAQDRSAAAGEAEEPAPAPEPAQTGGLFYVPPAAETAPVPEPEAVATTITGEKSGVYRAAEGIYYNNKTGYDIDVAALLAAAPDISAARGDKVLIIHTHGTEAYAPEEGNTYVPSDPSRTTDRAHSVVRVGDVLAETLTARGITVIHDTGLYDYPSYKDSYKRSYEAIRRYLADDPSIRAVIDLHRDALEAEDGTVYKTVAEVDGEVCSQVMIIVGTNWSGLDHPDWQSNLTVGLHLQKTMAERYPSLARPLKISQYRYNQQATHGSLIIEVGCNGNTQREAEQAVRYFGDCLAAVMGA